MTKYQTHNHDQYDSENITEKKLAILENRKKYFAMTLRHKIND